MEETPFADHIADGIFCECALSLASDRARVLREFHRILRPGGLLVLSDIVVNPPDPDEPPGPFDDFPTDPDDRPRLAAAPHPAAACACRATTLEENLALLRAASLTPIAVEDHRTALRALAAALVWAYGRSGLDELAGLGACGSGDERTGRLGYVLIISENGPDGEREAGRSD
jgi:SAM-dependent methyltransferase